MKQSRLWGLLFASLLTLIVACSQGIPDRDESSEKTTYGQIPVAKKQGDSFTLNNQDFRFYWGFFTKSYAESDPINLLFDEDENRRVQIVKDYVDSHYYLVTFAQDLELDRELFLRLRLRDTGDLLTLENKDQNLLEIYFCKSCDSKDQARFIFEKEKGIVFCKDSQMGPCIRSQRVYGD